MLQDVLAELKLRSHAALGSEAVSSLETRTKGPLLKEAVVPPLGKAQLVCGDWPGLFLFPGLILGQIFWIEGLK